MPLEKTVYILGAGAVGLTLAARLAEDGRPVILVRTSRDDVPPRRQRITIHDGLGATIQAEVETTSLARLDHIDGLIVITAKSFANSALAAALTAKNATGPVVILQNGLGVEDAFSAFPQVMRCVLYVTGQTTGENEVTFRWINSSPIGVVQGDQSVLETTVAALHSEGFPFHPEPDIARQAWRKTIINAVFNSICPLLDIDNGVFVRREEIAALAREVVYECLTLAHAEGIALTEEEVMAQVFKISGGSQGVLISTLQDIKNHRPTEMDALNLALARRAASHTPPIPLPRTELLGRLVLARSLTL